MKKLMMAAAAAALTMPAWAMPAAAQDAPTAQRMGDEVGWARVSYIKFKPGKRGRAMEIIQNYYAKADAMVDAETGKKSGIHGVHMESGEWDAIYIFPMSGGPSDLTWLTSPEDVAWMAKFTELAGGQEKATAMLEEFDGLIERELTDIAHFHPDY